MSAVYPKCLETLVGWALLGGGPTNAVAKVVGVDAVYNFDSTHNDIADLGANTVSNYANLVGFSYVNGVLDANDVDLLGLTPPDVFDAAVVLLEWTLPAAGSLLICYIDQSIDGSVPQVINSTSGQIIWNVLGICVL